MGNRRFHRQFANVGLRRGLNVSGGGRSTQALAGKMANPLREAIKSQFYPFMASRGFVRAKSRSPLETIFRRMTAEKVHVCELQWDKYGGPCFVLNFGEGPIGGVEVRGVHVPSAEFEPHQSESLGSLQPRRGPHVRSWFRLKKPLLQAITSRSRWYPPEIVVAQLIDLFAEVEAWWSEKRVGPHLDFIRHAG